MSPSPAHLSDNPLRILLSPSLLTDIPKINLKVTIMLFSFYLKDELHIGYA